MLQGGGLIPFEIGISVVGDVTVALWLGDHNMGNRIHLRPSFAYAFHTAFVSGGLHRISMRQLDIFDATVLPATPAAQSSFFMDMTFDDVDTAAQATCASCQQHSSDNLHARMRNCLLCFTARKLPSRPRNCPWLL